MYIPEKPPQAIDFYKEEEENPEETRDMIIEVSPTTNENTAAIHIPAHHHHQHQHQHHHHHQVLGCGETTSSGGEDNTAANPSSSSDLKAPKKRAETWVQEETRALISLRREIDSLFNTSKSNKHLWDQISMKMREKGFDRSPTMCTDKWRNLLKEFKKIKQNGDGNASAKMSYYKEIEEILKERNKSGGNYKSPPPTSNKVDSFMPFSDKGMCLKQFSILIRIIFLVSWEGMGLCGRGWLVCALLNCDYYCLFFSPFCIVLLNVSGFL